MKQSEIMPLIGQGKLLTVAEYRHFTPDVLEYKDKKTGMQVKRDVIHHSVEFGPNQGKVMQWVNDGERVQDMKAPFPKGTKFILEIESLKEERGFYNINGTMHVLEEEGKK